MVDYMYKRQTNAIIYTMCIYTTHVVKTQRFKAFFVRRFGERKTFATGLDLGTFQTQDQRTYQLSY